MATKKRNRAPVSATSSSSRIYKEGRVWYFATREKTVEGPYPTAAEADAHLDDYLMMVCSGLVPPGCLDLAERQDIPYPIEEN